LEPLSQVSVVRAGGKLALPIGLRLWYHKIMSKSIRGTTNKPKKIGRPVTTGKGTQIGMRWHEPLLGMIDKWAAGQDDKPDRPDAIRRLVQLGLAAATPSDAKPARKPKVH